MISSAHQLVLVCSLLASLLQAAVASHGYALPAIDEVTGSLAQQLNPVPDDETMDKRYGIPALAQKIVAARADAEPPADAVPLLGPVEICECACLLCQLAAAARTAACLEASAAYAAASAAAELLGAPLQFCCIPQPALHHCCCVCRLRRGQG